MSIETTRRYADNTQVQPVDRRRMLGFAPNVPHMMANPQATNQPSEQIPQGQLIVFTPHVFPALDGDFEPAPTEKSPRDFARTLTMLFHTGENDWGYRTLTKLSELDYDPQTGYDEADAYYEAVHPSFAEIGRTCEMGLEVLVEDVNCDKTGKAYARPCNTCRLEWLNSMECRERMFNSGLDQAILADLKDTLIQVYTKGNEFVRFKLGQTKGDMQSAAAGQPGKRAYQDVDYYYMALLHEKAPHVQQAEIIAEQNKQQGAMLVEAVKAAVGGQVAQPVTEDDAAEYAEFLRFKAMKAAASTPPAETPSEATETPKFDRSAAMKARHAARKAENE